MTGCLVKLLIMVIVLLASPLLAGHPGLEHVLRIDDFEDGDLRAPVGASWIPLADGPGPNRLVAAVGSALFFGDDVPSQGAAVIR